VGYWLDTLLLSNEYPGSFYSLVKRPEHETDHSLPFSADINTEYYFTSIHSQNLALVIEGEFILNVGERTRYVKAGY
jgi:hypothetical protein